MPAPWQSVLTDRQQHKRHEREYVHPTRELPIQLEIFMTHSLLKAPRRHGKESQWKAHKSGGERDGGNMKRCLKLAKTGALNLSCPDSLLSLHGQMSFVLKNDTVDMERLIIHLTRH